MKRILIILLLLQVFSSYAQNISVVSFQKLGNDLTARTQRIDDQNGEPCALIKVVVSGDGFIFEGDGLGIVKTQHKTGEYYVYVPRGAKYLTVKHKDLGVLRQYPYPERIEKQVTYELVLSNAKVKTVVEQDAGGHFLALSVTPRNATIYIDNELRSLDSNGELSEFLPYGKHTYRIEAASYVAQTGDFTIKRDAATELKVTLQSALATLSVDCSTQDAEIYINQQFKSRKSWRGELKAGMYLIEVKLSGHRNYKRSVQLAQQEVKSITIPALEPVYGSLTVNYKPIGSNVILDGKNIGKSPNVFEKILVGNHTLIIEKDEYKQADLTVTIEEAKMKTVSGELELRPKNSSLKEDYKPAKFFLNIQGGMFSENNGGMGANISGDYVLVNSWWEGHFTIGGFVGTSVAKDEYKVSGTKIYEQRFTNFSIMARATFGLNITDHLEVHAGAMIGPLYHSLKYNYESGYSVDYEDNHEFIFNAAGVAGFHIMLSASFALTTELISGSHQTYFNAGISFKI